MAQQKRKRRTKAQIEAEKKQEKKPTVYDPEKHDIETIIQREINKDVIEYKSKYNAIHDKYSPEPEGLGDTIEKVFEATGISKLAKWVLGEDCGCDERKKKLNKMFPYHRPKCLEESEYEWLHNYYTKQGNTIDMRVQNEFLAIYNRVFNVNETPTTCSDCYRDWHRKMNKVYLEYKNTN